MSTLPGRQVFAVFLLLTTALPACTTLTDWLEGESRDQTSQSTLGGGNSGAYLQELYELASGDPATQAEIYADAHAAVRFMPDTASQLRYALVLATPGHPGSDAEGARSRLRALLAQPERLTATEKSLATIWLAEVEARLVLNAETRRLRTEATRAANSESAAVAERIASVEAENRQLRQALTEAEQKLEAITSIERSIREQTEGNGQ